MGMDSAEGMLNVVFAGLGITMLVGLAAVVYQIIASVF